MLQDNQVRVAFAKHNLDYNSRYQSFGQMKHQLSSLEKRISIFVSTQKTLYQHLTML